MIRCAAIGMTVAIILGVCAARAETAVTFGRIIDGADFDEAAAFLRAYLKPRDYDIAEKFRFTGVERYRNGGNTLDRFIREFILLGKADVNDDGIPERFYLFEDTDWCGSAGCMILIVGSGGHGPRLLCSVDGDEGGVLVTDRVTIHGYHELEVPNPVYWYGGETCDTDTAGGDGYGTRRKDPLR